jgi:hypothetical protein
MRIIGRIKNKIVNKTIQKLQSISSEDETEEKQDKVQFPDQPVLNRSSSIFPGKSGIGTQQNYAQFPERQDVAQPFPGKPVVYQSSLPKPPGKSEIGTQQNYAQSPERQDVAQPFPGKPVVNQSSLPNPPGKSKIGIQQNYAQFPERQDMAQPFPGKPVVYQSSLPNPPGKSEIGTQQNYAQFPERQDFAQPFPGKPLVYQSSLPKPPGKSEMGTQQNYAQFPERQDVAQPFPFQSGIGSINNPTISLSQKLQNFIKGFKKTNHMNDHIPRNFRNGIRGQARNVVYDSFLKGNPKNNTKINVLTFEFVIEDEEGNMIDSIPVEVNSKQKTFSSRIKEGDHIILKGKRNKYGIIHAKKVYNYSTKSIVTGKGGLLG